MPIDDSNGKSDAPEVLARLIEVPGKPERLGVTETPPQQVGEEAMNPNQQDASSESTLLNNPATSEGARTTIFGQPCIVHWEGSTRVISYESGGVCSEVQFDSGERHGLDRSWYPTGKLRSQGFWDNNMREGRWDYFSEQGVVLRGGDYSETKKSGEWITRWADNSVESIGTYRDGLREGEWIFYASPGVIDDDKSGWYAANVRADRK